MASTKTQSAHRNEADVCYFLQTVPYWKYSPRLEPIHMRFFGGTAVDRSIRFSSFRERESGPIARIIMNVHNMHALFGSAAMLFVTEPVVSILRSSTKIRLRRAEISSAYDFPYCAGDSTWEDEVDDWENYSSDALVQKLAQKYVVPVPRVELYELLVPMMEDLVDAGGPWIERTISEPENGLGTIEARWSPPAVRQFGLAWNWGWFCSAEVFTQLNPFITRPYFYVERLPG